MGEMLGLTPLDDPWALSLLLRTERASFTLLAPAAGGAEEGG